MRELTVQSETVVVAAPVNPAVPRQFKAIRVLLGTALKEGELFEIADFSLYDLTIPLVEGAPLHKPVRFAEVMLFLGPKMANAPTARFPVVLSGLRGITAQGAMYYPEQQRNPGGYVLYPYRTAANWDQLVHKAAAAAAEIRYVQSLKAIDDPHRRNLALLDWVERHRREFGGGLKMIDGDEPTAGWGSLETTIFDWIFEYRIPQDCWAAVKLYAELNEGKTPHPRQPAFGSRAGRDLLLTVGLDPDNMTGHRVRALDMLSRYSTLLAPGWEGQPDIEVLNEKEQAALIDRVIPLLKDPSPAVRFAATDVLVDASCPPTDDWKALRTQRPLPALTAAYKEQAPGAVRDKMAFAVRAIGGPDQWKELTGNPYGLVMSFKEPSCLRGAEVSCWVLLLTGKEDLISQEQTVVFERLDEKAQKVVETKEILSGKQESSEVLLYDTVKYIHPSLADLTPGVWRMTVKGVAGDDKAPWTSEPRLLHLAPPPKPDQPNLNPTPPRIVFDP